MSTTTRRRPHPRRHARHAARHPDPSRPSHPIDPMSGSSCASASTPGRASGSCASVGIVGLLATVAVLVWAPTEDFQLRQFDLLRAIGFPMTVLLPMIAILLVTGEWSQRSGLTTFTLVPNRGRVHRWRGRRRHAWSGGPTTSWPSPWRPRPPVVGCGRRVTQMWDQDLRRHRLLRSGQTPSRMMVGFMLAASSGTRAGAIMAYFALLSSSLSGLTELLAPRRSSGSDDLRPWVDVNYAQARPASTAA